MSVFEVIDRDGDTLGVGETSGDDTAVYISVTPAYADQEDPATGRAVFLTIGEVAELVDVLGEYLPAAEPVDDAAGREIRTKALKDARNVAANLFGTAGSGDLIALAEYIVGGPIAVLTLAKLSAK